MNLSLLTSKENYFGFSIAFYSDYACLDVEKFVEQLKSEF